MSTYIPRKGDLVVLTIDPQSGHEQMGRRPALVVSNDLFNKQIGFAMVCPITNTNRKSPFHLKMPETSSLTGYVMTEQLKSIDYRSRKVKFVENGSKELLESALNILDACLY